ncbi:MAG: recombinase family protein [Bacillota bacterium]
MTVKPVLVAAIYLRVSTGEQERKGYSIPEQRRACREKAEALAQAAGSQLVVHEFVDAVGGDWLNRPALDQVLEFLRSARVDVFLCMDPDRFSRLLKNQLIVAEEIERSGARLEFVHGGYDHSPEGQAFFQMRGVFAQLEKAKILERTARGKRGKIRAGGVPQVIHAYGYRFLKGVKGRVPLEVREDQAQWVRTIYRWCAEGMSTQAIAQELTRLGIPPPRGCSHRWHRSTVRDILRNPLFKGVLVLNKVDARGLQAARQLPPEYRRQHGLKLTYRMRPESEWVRLPAPAIVSAELWQAAQDSLDRRRQRRRGRYARALPAGSGRCALCGGPIYYGATGKGGRTYLVCRNRHGPRAPGRDRCPLPGKLAAWVERAVFSRIARWLADPEVVALALAEMSRRAGQHPELARLEEERRLLAQHLADKTAAHARAVELFVSGQSERTRSLAREAVERLENELAALQERAAALAQRIASLRPGPPMSGVERAQSGRDPLGSIDAAAVEALLLSLPPQAQQDLVAGLVQYWVLHPTPQGHPPRVEVYPRQD